MLALQFSFVPNDSLTIHTTYTIKWSQGKVKPISDTTRFYTNHHNCSDDVFSWFPSKSANINNRSFTNEQTYHNNKFKNSKQFDFKQIKKHMKVILSNVTPE